MKWTVQKIIQKVHHSLNLIVHGMQYNAQEAKI